MASLARNEGVTFPEIYTLPKELQAQIKITLVADFDPFQASDITADPDIKTTQYKHKGSNNILGMGWLANEDEQGKTSELIQEQVQIILFLLS